MKKDTDCFVVSIDPYQVHVSANMVILLKDILTKINCDYFSPLGFIYSV